MLGFHHFGTFCLFATLAFLIAATVTAPVFSDVAFLTVTLSNQTVYGTNTSITFGTFGWCLRDVAGSTSSNSIDYCSPVGVGYDIVGVIVNATNTDYSSTSLKDLTDGLALHPACAALIFLAFLIAACSHFLGFIFAAVIASLTWVLVLITLVVDAVLFGVLKSRVGNGLLGDATASYSVAFWLVLASVVLLFFGVLGTLFACVTDRRSAKHY